MNISDNSHTKPPNPNTNQQISTEAPTRVPPIENSIPAGELRALIGDTAAGVVGCQCGREHSLNQLNEEFTLPAGMPELLSEGPGRPRLEVFGPSYLLRINRVARQDEAKVKIESLHVVFHQKWLVVFEDPEGIGIAWHPGPEGTGLFFAPEHTESTLSSILEGAIESFRSALVKMEDDVRDCEASIFGTFEDDIETVYRLGSDASTMESSIATLCRFVDHIPPPSTSEHSTWSARAAAHSEDAHEVLARVTSIHARLTQLVTVYSTLVAQKQNEDMKRISAWAAILFTPSLIGAFYGMNFANLPGLTWNFGYPLAIVAMVGVGAGLYAIFHRQRWL